MMHRFETQKTGSSSKSFLLSVVCFCVIVCLFLLGVSRVSDRTDAQASETLHQAVSRGIVRCYTIEGAYPESLQYLKDYYGLTYDEERFFVDYQVLGRNLLPDVTIIDRREQP